jgi:hypothetical protein
MRPPAPPPATHSSSHQREQSKKTMRIAPKLAAPPALDFGGEGDDEGSRLRAREAQQQGGIEGEWRVRGLELPSGEA